VSYARIRPGVVLVAVLCVVSFCCAGAQQRPLAEQGPVFSEKVSELMGVYEALPLGVVLPGSVAARPPTLDTLPLTPAALKAQVAAQHGPDPKDLCQVLGPFRMMARADTRFEILRDAPNKLVMLFEKSSWGNVRNVRLDADPLPVTPQLRPMWNGDSTAKWDGDALLIHSVHFTNKTWLNENGVVNSKLLQLTERMRVIDNGQYLEYQATAVDPETLTAPVSYTRYFRRSKRVIREDNCFDHQPAFAKP
jgi:hypothetical protein